MTEAFNQTIQSPLPAEIIAQAAAWHVQLSAPDCSTAEQLAFAHWHEADARHAQAYARMQALWAGFEAAEHPTALSALKETLKPRKLKLNKKLTAKLNKKLGASALLLLLALSGWQLRHSEIAGYWLADYRTAVGQQNLVKLADGSQLTLNTNTAVNITFSADQRHIALLRGEIHLQVAKDKQRPLIVETAHGTARALGTEFVVRKHAEATEVTVQESSVRACAMPETCVTLHANESTHIPQGGLQLQTAQPVLQKQVVDAQAAAAWTQAKLLVDDQPLVAVLQELSRYRQGYLYFDPQALAQIRVSGVYALNDTQRTLQALVATAPIRMVQYTPWLVVIKPE